MWFIYFFATFFFLLSLSIGKRSILAKIWGGGVVAPPAPSVSTGLYKAREYAKILCKLYFKDSQCFECLEF